jgi:hypothetical protein
MPSSSFRQFALFSGGLPGNGDLLVALLLAAEVRILVAGLGFAAKASLRFFRLFLSSPAAFLSIAQAITGCLVRGCYFFSSGSSIGAG